jgi:hypothetical protein
LAAVEQEQKAIREQAQVVKKIAATVDPKRGSSAKRRKRFDRLQGRLAASKDQRLGQMAVVMASFVVGLFAGGKLKRIPWDNLELERWFRLPKSHERHIHGRSHAGVRLVQEGASLMPVLDAHKDGKTFTANELLDYRHAKLSLDEEEAIQRRKIMRKARSKKKRPILLKELEEQYLRSS